MQAAVNMLARQLHNENSDLIVLPVHPGWVATCVSASTDGFQLEADPLPFASSNSQAGRAGLKLMGISEFPKEGVTDVKESAGQLSLWRPTAL